MGALIFRLIKSLYAERVMKVSIFGYEAGKGKAYNGKDYDMIVAGIDPGLAKKKPLGFAIIDCEPHSKARLIWYSRHTLKNTDYDGLWEWMSELLFGEQLSYERVTKIFRKKNFPSLWLLERGVELLAIEDAHAVNVRSAGNLQAVVQSCAVIGRLHNIPVVKVHPSKVKQALGVDQHAKGADLSHAANVVLGLIGSKNKIMASQHDVASAVGVALAGQNVYWQKSLVE